MYTCVCVGGQGAQWNQSLPEPNPPPQALTTLTQMPKKKKKCQFYTVCHSEATIHKTVEQPVLPQPHLDMPVPVPLGAVNPGPPPGRTQLSYSPPTPCPRGEGKSLGVKARNKGTSTLGPHRGPLVNWKCVCVVGNNRP